jgi:hypothetical protein
MAACNRVIMEVDYRSLPEMDNNIQRFAFDERHLGLRENLAAHTVEGTQERMFLQRINPQESERQNGTATRYVQTFTIKQGHLRDFMAALKELSDFHAENEIPPITVWAERG